MSRVYSFSSVESIIEKLVDAGYEHIQLSEGCLGIGDHVLLSGNPNKYSPVIREVFINAWSSGQTIRRIAKISKKLQDEIDRSYEDAA